MVNETGTFVSFKKGFNESQRKMETCNALLVGLRNLKVMVELLLPKITERIHKTTTY